jgi:WD40 repeat protein
MKTHWNVSVLILLGLMPGQTRAAPEVAQNEAVLELKAPPGATLRVDGGPAGERPIRFSGLENGSHRLVKVEAEFRDGTKHSHVVLVRGGWHVLLPLRPVRAMDVETVPQFGHNVSVNAVALSPDEKYLLTGGWDNLAILWDVTTGRKLRSFHGHSSQVTSVTFSPDGKSILTGSSDRTAILWDIQSGNRLRTLKGHTEAVTAVSFTANGNQVLTGSKDKTVILWVAATGEKVRSFQGSANVTCLACSPDSKSLAMGLGEKRVVVWVLSSGEQSHSIDAHVGAVAGVAYSPDGKHILTGGTDELVCFWDAATGQKVRNFRGHNDEVTSVAFSADGKHIVSGSGDKTAIVWDATTGAKTRILKGHPRAVSSVLISREGRQAFVVSGRNVTCWGLPDGEKVRSFGGPADIVNSVMFSPDGRQLRVGTTNGGGLQWSEDTGLKSWALEAPGWIMYQQFSADGTRIVSTIPNENMAIWDVGSGKKICSLAAGGTTWGTRFAISPNGKQVLTASESGADLWDAVTGRKIRSFIEEEKDKVQMVVNSVAFSPDGKRILVQAELGGTIIWDVTTGRKNQSFNTEKVSFSVLEAIGQFSPDGKRVLLPTVVLDAKHGADLWDIGTGNRVRTFQPESSLTTAAFSLDGAFLVTGDDDNEVAIWDVATGKKIHILKGHTDSVTGLAFSPDGRRLLTGSRDGTARLWDVSTGDELLQLVCINGGAGWLALTPEGLFDGSQLDREKVCFRLGGGLNVVDVDRFFNDFYHPGLVAGVWRGDRPFPIMELGIRLAPIVRITSPAQGGDTETDRVTIEATVTDRGGGIAGPWLFHNGARILPPGGTERGDKLVRQRFQVRLVEGENRLVVKAARADKFMESDPDQITIHYIKPLEKGTLYIVAVGISTYAQEGLNLKYAASDAQRLSTVFSQRGKGTLYKETVVRLLVDEQATRKAILESIAKVAKEAKAQDTLVVCLSGHGTMLGQRYFFIPHEFRRHKEKTQDEDVHEQCLADDVLSEELAKVPALKRVLILDTCHSGGAVLPVRKGRGDPFAFQGSVVRMSRLQGLFTIGASAAGEEAQEADELEHGVLSYTLLAGLKGVTKGPLVDKEIRTRSPEGVVDVLEWFKYADDHVPKLSKKYFLREQDVQISSQGSSFPLLPVRDTQP